MEMRFLSMRSTQLTRLPAWSCYAFMAGLGLVMSLSLVGGRDGVSSQRTVHPDASTSSAEGFERAPDSHLVDILSIDPTFVCDIRYATADNFTGQVLYPSTRCLLVEPAARALVGVQNQLKTRGLGLKIWDAYRPLAVQWLMWNNFPHLHAYIGNPAVGSKHNRGAAVDLTLVDLATGHELAMPTPFDDLSERAHRRCPNTPLQARANSYLLEILMVAAGFEPLLSEWWHFNWHAWAEYPLLDVDAESI